MRASARIEVARRGGRDVLVDARSEPPLSVRRTPERILLVGSAAGPVGGDVLDLDVLVGAGARAAIGTAAATLVWPGRPCHDGIGARPSRTTTRISVGPDGHLDWRPEPTVSVAGSRHVARAIVDLAAGAAATIVEEVSLGRSGEPSGHIDVELRVARDGRPLVHHTEHLGPDVPGWGGAVHVGAARHLLTAVVVGSPAGAPHVRIGPADGLPPDTAVATLPVAPDVTVTLAVAPDRPTAHRSVWANRPE